MQVAIWIIAIAEVIRLIQNSIQLVQMKIARKTEIELKRISTMTSLRALISLRVCEEIVRRVFETGK